MNAPDPQRLGGLAWVRRTGGRLSRTERRRLLAAIAVGQWDNAVGRVKLALGRLPAAAAQVDLGTFQVPDSKFAREAEEACAELPPTLQGHSYRTWLFGRALAAVDRSKVDGELFYCGALLHDYGIVRPTGNRDFTLGSVERMLSCGTAAELAEERADLLADGICVHTTPGVKVETDGVIGCYLQWGAMVDGAGLRDSGAGGTLRAARSLWIAASRANGAVRLLSYVVVERLRRSSSVAWKCPIALS